VCSRAILQGPKQQYILLVHNGQTLPLPNSCAKFDFALLKD
jgi:hypothetical protein